MREVESIWKRLDGVVLIIRSDDNSRWLLIMFVHRH